MYIPNDFSFNQYEEQIAFMQQYNFATVITYNGTRPIATHLPFLIEQRDDRLFLRSHLAAHNEQAQFLTKFTSLVIFSTPHAYISPTHYDKFQSVPTWDYVAVHAYGTAVLLHTDQEKLALLEQTIHFYEKEYLDRWNQLDEKYKKIMLPELVAFEIEVKDIQAQKKLSQNKSSAERARIIETLESSEWSHEKDLAQFIKQIK